MLGVITLTRILLLQFRRLSRLLAITYLTFFVSAARIVKADDNVGRAHEVLFRETKFPSAEKCQTCHPIHYKEWSASPHAYALLSPVNNAMQAKITKLTNGTNGDFCIRCHTPIGLQMGEPVFMSSMDRHPTSREGITCVVCHRIEYGYGKVSARFPLEEGDILEPIYGPTGNKELKRVIESEKFSVITERDKEGRAIHTDAKLYPEITTSAFCGSCHDVNHIFGFRLEEAFSEFKASPAAKKDVSCHDCHMSKEPGTPSGFNHEPVAIVGGNPTKPRKRTNHMFVGPDYSIVHPGIFPHNPAAQQMASLREWLQFDFESGWGTDDFEDNVMEDYAFPARWQDVADRYEARDILGENLALLDKVAEARKKLLQTGYQIGDVIIDKADQNGIQFKVEVKNGTEGHNVPTGFDAERVVFLRVTITDKNGKEVFRSGDLDPNGDLRDIHSHYVHNGELKRDKYLFSLQSKFIVRMLRGGEREQVLAVNFSVDPLPFIRPAKRSTILLGRPPGVRKHRKTIPPLGSKWAKYKVSRSELRTSEGPYQAEISLVAGMVPINLIYEIQDVGFDYGMSTRDVADAVVAGHQTLWQRRIVLETGRIEQEVDPLQPQQANSK